LEYWGFIPKINGQYRVPEVAFETLVNWIKFKSVENRKGVTGQDKVWALERYKEERKNMQKRLGRFSLNIIIQSIGLIPKFDLQFSPLHELVCGGTGLNQAGNSSTSSSDGSNDSNGDEDLITGCGPKKTKFTTSLIVGVSDGVVADTSIIQLDELIGAGEIDISPNIFFESDVIVIPYSKFE
jgi:hypothetical protein